MRQAVPGGYYVVVLAFDDEAPARADADNSGSGVLQFCRIGGHRLLSMVSSNWAYQGCKPLLVPGPMAGASVPYTPGMLIAPPHRRLTPVPENQCKRLGQGGRGD